MKGLRLLPAGGGDGHQGEIFCCAYTADGGFVLSAGWDGHLRLWETSNGEAVTALRASSKPLSACAASPDGRHWLSGSMEGVLSVWDAVAHQSRQTSVVHIRPISAIRFSPDGRSMATASWDRQVIIHQVGSLREGKMLSGHADIVSGCGFTPDGKQLVSWSYDATLRLWDVASARCLHTFQGHRDRIIAGALSPDGRWVASASRDGSVKLWDVGRLTEVAAVDVFEPRACFFLLDAQTLVATDAAGKVLLLSVPGLDTLSSLETGFKVHAADLSPSGAQMAVGGEEGRIRLLAIEGGENDPLVVTPTRGVKEKRTVLGRLFGSSRLQPTFRFTCPACRHAGEVEELPQASFKCKSCRRLLRVDGGVRELQLQ